MADSAPSGGDEPAISSDVGVAAFRHSAQRLSSSSHHNGHPISSVPHNINHPKQSSRPSTSKLFLLHFFLPTIFLICASNISDILDGLIALMSRPRENTEAAKNDVLMKEKHDSTKPPSIPFALSSNSKYRHEINAAIERKKQKASPQPAAVSSLSSSQQQFLEKNRRPMGPQSSLIYQKTEAKIKDLRSKYEQSHNSPSEYLAAIRYADFLKYRDVNIHDGGTYQMESIDVYSHAITLLEDIWRESMAKGEEVRLPDNYVVGYKGLNQDMFVDYDSKSVEGMLCSTHSSLGKVYFMSNMFQRAVQSYEDCLSYDHDYLDALTYRAQALVILGKYEEAGRDYKRVLEMDNDRIFVDSVTGMAKVLTAAEDAVPEGWDFLVNILKTELPHQTELFDQIKLSNNNRGIKHYADALKRMHLAMFAYHDVKTKKASEAWKHLSKGNEYKLSTVAPFDAAIERERVLRVKQVFVPDFFPTGIGSKTLTPIFIIGFVRSGSTLLERILDAHPLIVGTGEDSVFNGRLDTIRNEIVKASMAGDFIVLRQKVTELADDVVTDMRTRWEIIDDNIRDEKDSEEKGNDPKEERSRPIRFSDKMLTNYMNVGFIHLLFPNALILHVARDPMASIFSAFKHDFPPGNLDYSSEFAGLAQLYHSYRDVMEHWDKVLPGRVTHIRYEDMVTDLPNIAPKIIEATGVPWDPTVLEFHKKKQAVNTLSTTQVRRGVYSHHFESWKRYEEFLQPLMDLVGVRVKHDLKTTLPGYNTAQTTKPQAKQPSHPTPGGC